MRRRYSLSTPRWRRRSAGERRAQLVESQAAAQGVFELRLGERRILRLQQLLVALLADELTVFLKRRNREDLLCELFIADMNALALGFNQGNLLVDHLAQHLLIDIELAQQLIIDAGAELLAVLLYLEQVPLLEVASGHWPPVNLGNRLARSGPTDVAGCRYSWRDEKDHHRHRTSPRLHFSQRGADACDRAWSWRKHLEKKASYHEKAFRKTVERWYICYIYKDLAVLSALPAVCYR